MRYRRSLNVDSLRNCEKTNFQNIWNFSQNAVIQDPSKASKFAKFKMFDVFFLFVVQEKHIQIELLKIRSSYKIFG